jgi:hypothetical protein
LKNLYLLILILFSTVCKAQQGEWVWISGSNTSGSVGNYGVQGVPDPANEPPAVYEPCEWIDQDGNLWFFGGKNAFNYFGCDLWKYNISTNIWTWMKGSGVLAQYDPGVYGTIGVPAPNNHPPSSGFGNPTWVDKQGNLWLHSGYYNDMWMYDVTINMWTCVNDYPIAGAVFGTMGVPDTLNNPGSGHERTSSWTDVFGNLWLWGGSINNVGISDAMWCYDIVKKQWTWVKGSSNGSAPAVYGTQGVEDSANTPGARWAYSHWVDNNGHFWFFGGNTSLTGALSHDDLWKYNPFTNNWTWMGGSASTNTPGNYGVKCHASPTNWPASRFENRAVATDEYGNFWMFGGAKNIAIGVTRNDLWMYDVSINQWIWVSGDNVLNPSGSWGNKGVSSINNKPNGRMGAIMWSDKDGHLYMFGGSINSNITNPINDLWKFTIDTLCLSTGLSDIAFTKNEITVQPNPTTGELTINIYQNQSGFANFIFYNMLGEVVHSESENILTPGFTKTININSLSDGVYNLVVMTKEGKLVKKIVKY